MVSTSTEILTKGTFDNESLTIKHLIKLISKDVKINDIMLSISELESVTSDIKSFLTNLNISISDSHKSNIENINNIVSMIKSEFVKNDDKRLSDNRDSKEHRHNINDIDDFPDVYYRDEIDSLLSSIRSIIPEDYVKHSELTKYLKIEDASEFIKADSIKSIDEDISKLSSNFSDIDSKISEIIMPDSINDLADVDIVDPKNNQALVFENGLFVNKAISSSGGEVYVGVGMNHKLDEHISDTSNPHSVTKAQVGLGNVEDIALSTWAGSTSLTTLGTITTGTWNAGLIDIAYGGTGQSTAQGAINALTQVAAATNEFVLTKDTATGDAIWKVSAGGGGIAIGDAITSATEGSVLFAGVGGILQQDNVNFFWDDTNNRLGIGTTTPNAPLQVSGYVNFDDTLINTALGASALANNTTGSSNLAVGDSAALLQTTGDNNLAIGESASRSNLTGSRNVAIGGLALSNNTSSNNIAIGYRALTSNTTASQNTAIGWQALASNTTGSVNLAIGAGALLSNVNGAVNIAIGNDALRNGASPYGNTAIGGDALKENTAAYNVAIGAASSSSNTSGAHNTAIGSFTLRSNVTGAGNTAIGESSLRNNLASGNLAIGYLASYTNTTGTGNVAIGNNALENSTTGNSNTAIGAAALKTSTTSSGNIAIGGSCMAFATGDSNTAIGNSVLGSCAGGKNVGIGALSSLNTTTGGFSTGIGYASNQNSTTAFYNVAIGAYALNSNITGQYNTVIGAQAARLATGANSVSIGYQAGYNSAGNANVFLGYKSGFSETGSNKLYISNSSTATPLIGGDFSTGEIFINGDFETRGAVRRKTRAVTNTDTATNSDNIIFANASTTSFVETLPTAASMWNSTYKTSQEITIVKTDATANTITINNNSGVTIAILDGVTLTSATIISDGTNTHIV